LHVAFVDSVKARPVLRVAVLVAAAAALRVSAVPAPTALAPSIAWTVGDPALQQLQTLLRPTLDANRKRFRGQLGEVDGFGAGAGYPQIWLRDSATLVPLTRWLYPRETLGSWLEEHLAAQQPGGGLHDWIAAGEAARLREWAPRARDVYRGAGVVLSADTNTTESDQESSAVRAAYAAFLVSGDVGWLRRDVLGEPLLRRLERALDSVYDRRRDTRTGLVTSALTADWGDVSPAWPDQRAIYLDERTPRAVGLYTNALFVQAARELALLHAHAGDGVGAARWVERAAGIAAAVEGLLWQERRGFFRMHLLLTPQLAPGFPDTADVFALGGNAHALLAGLARGERALHLLDVADERRRRHGLATVGAVLLPPLRDGAFAHPLMARAWHYQNGGQWDWIGGRFLLAAYAAGDSERATAQLAAVAQRVVKAGGLHEWFDREGHGQGSATYAGAAAALGQAVIEGLFGVGLRLERLDLRVRLGERDGALRLEQPATGTRVAYRHAYSRAARRLTLEVDSSARTPGTLAVRLPRGARVTAVRLDGKAAAWRAETVGRDEFVALDDVAWGRRRVEVLLAPR
jgi:hypothetical protein